MSEPNLLEIHHEMLRRIVVARVGMGDADDVLQEVAMAAHRGQLPTDEKQQKYWLCSVAIRQCALHLRRKCRSENSYSIDVVDSLGATSAKQSDRLDDPVFFLMARESRQQVASAVALLTEEARNLLVAKIVHGMTYEQIAEKFGLTKDKVEYRVGTARKKLKQHMIESGFSAEDMLT